MVLVEQPAASCWRSSRSSWSASRWWRSALVLAFRYPLNTALTVGASLAQIGEFSFILAALGVSLGLLPAEAQSLILAGALISIALNPLVFAGHRGRRTRGSAPARASRGAWSAAAIRWPSCR